MELLKAILIGLGEALVAPVMCTVAAFAFAIIYGYFTN